MELGCSGMLTIFPNGKASILPGGDVFYDAVYKIKGNKLKVTLGKTDFTYKIISDEKLELVSNGKLWIAQP